MDFVEFEWFIELECMLGFTCGLVHFPRLRNLPPCLGFVDFDSHNLFLSSGLDKSCKRERETESEREREIEKQRQVDQLSLWCVLLCC